MSALDALKVPGSLSFGGADLGLIRNVELRREEAGGTIEAEEYGGEAADIVLARVQYRVGVALRGWNADAIGAVFPNVTGSTISWPGAKPSGYFRSQDAAALVFTPKDSNYPSYTFAMAIPRAAAELVVEYAHREEHLILCEFTAIRDVSGGVTWGL